MLRSRARALRLNGLVEHWAEVDGSTWLAPLLQWEEDERAHRSLQRRIRAAKLSKFKTLTTSTGIGRNGSTARRSN
ncbi:hypothetical protein [Burkholderia stagnalis]|uniref:hypothetical protein n=1 Tax=Burkholderia stagnalis TaxID=1503054 RepID=UPI00075C4269|nr:hypothetical protein [Burkholderia stagnalis]KWI43229.1 hypothetical protein WT71_27615 [Burkholderia stagnalis]KWI69321.1 hypothetical protein WT73_15305 [Burkholderia stagnalis]MDY7807278.1 hypothetical protein [Burkholderia stagnalis]